MLYSFSCKNFYSFGEETTLNFVVPDKGTQNNGYFNSQTGTRLSKVEAVIGSNASGKTNLLRALSFLKWLIVDSFTLPTEFSLPAQSFAFGKNKNEPIELSVVFEIDSKIYDYKFTLGKNGDKLIILSETLDITSLVKEKNSTNTMFTRTWDSNLKKYSFDGAKFELPGGFETALRANASVVGSAARLNHEESKKIAGYWQKLKTNTTEIGAVRDPLSQANIPNWLEALLYYSDNEPLKKEAEKLLSRFDLGLNGIAIKKEQSANGVMNITVQGLHKFKGEEQPLRIEYESSGTKQLFILLKTILQVLDKGGIVILDEIDVNLHPEMVLALFDLFIQPETNPNNAQLLLSTHSHLILSKLDKWQIVLVEKDEDGISESWRLDDVEGIRADENYYAKYIAGAYGATPKL